MGHIGAAIAEAVHFNRGLRILCDRIAGDAANFLQRLASEDPGRTAKKGGVPEVEAALHHGVEHLTLPGHVGKNIEVPLDGIRIPEEMRGLH